MNISRKIAHAKERAVLEICLPIRWAAGQIRHGRGYTFWPKTTKAYKKVLSASLLSFKTDAFLDGPIAVTLHFVRPHPQSAPKRRWFTVKPDLDNLEKPTLDCMSGLLFADDGQIVEKHTHKEYGDAWELRIYIKVPQDETDE